MVTSASVSHRPHTFVFGRQGMRLSRGSRANNPMDLRATTSSSCYFLRGGKRSGFQHLRCEPPIVTDRTAKRYRQYMNKSIFNTFRSCNPSSLGFMGPSHKPSHHPSGVQPLPRLHISLDCTVDPGHQATSGGESECAYFVMTGH